MVGRSKRFAVVASMAGVLTGGAGAALVAATPAQAANGSYGAGWTSTTTTDCPPGRPCTTTNTYQCTWTNAHWESYYNWTWHRWTTRWVPAKCV
ncbi:hypothetical protein [Parafrankia sp. EUN1f]|uniref:hypothetical protein n=1 Tax=Parafrankia sp. EUN1f TaxID=102897 RepID=UPI0001C46817|nr:hypothetical protein [Parafrankia sp. EUN1f]EFC80926.1 hypothetical protein FrEUN1fDRAFT_5936 [Parafrankia sp. EUN1f]